jgi:hypothetical protein
LFGNRGLMSALTPKEKGWWCGYTAGPAMSLPFEIAKRFRRAPLKFRIVATLAIVLHPVGRDAERSELKRAFCSSLVL